MKDEGVEVANRHRTEFWLDAVLTIVLTVLAFAVLPIPVNFWTTAIVVFIAGLGAWAFVDLYRRRHPNRS